MRGHKTVLCCVLLSGLIVTLGAEPQGANRRRSGRGTTQSTRPAPQGLDCSPSWREVKPIAKRLESEYRDPGEFVKALDLALSIDPLSEGHATVFHSDDVSIFVMFPYGLYRSTVRDAIRMREPVDSADYPRAVVVNVSPSRIDAPDFVKIIVERDNVRVRPLASTLAPKLMETRMGAKRQVYSGQVIFPCAAFAPGATVVVTAIPASGTNEVLRLTSNLLERLR